MNRGKEQDEKHNRVSVSGSQGCQPTWACWEAGQTGMLLLNDAWQVGSACTLCPRFLMFWAVGKPCMARM